MITLAAIFVGWIAIIAAVALPFIGPARIKSLVDWIDSLPRFLVRLWMLVGAALGALFLLGVYSLFGALGP